MIGLTSTRDRRGGRDSFGGLRSVYSATPLSFSGIRRGAMAQLHHTLIAQLGLICTTFERLYTRPNLRNYHTFKSCT